MTIRQVEERQLKPRLWGSNYPVAIYSTLLTSGAAKGLEVSPELVTNKQ